MWFPWIGFESDARAHLLYDSMLFGLSGVLAEIRHKAGTLGLIQGILFSQSSSVLSVPHCQDYRVIGATNWIYPGKPNVISSMYPDFVEWGSNCTYYNFPITRSAAPTSSPTCSCDPRVTVVTSPNCKQMDMLCTRSLSVSFALFFRMIYFTCVFGESASYGGPF